MLSVFLSTFATFFVIIDPIGVAAISLSLTTGKTLPQKRVIIWRASIVAFVILLVFGFAGESFLKQIGISMAAFRVSGGILLFLTAIEMLFGHRAERRSNVEGGDDPSIYPLAMPLLAGPGAMTAIILTMGRQQGNISMQIVIVLTLALVLLLTVFLTMIVNRYSHHLGKTGIEIINRFLAIVLAALAVQFIADGVFEYIKGVS